MLEELRELNNEEDYNVPTDFRSKVIERINKEKASNKIRYIIPACSAVAVVLFAVIVTVTGKVGTKISEKENMLDFDESSVQGVRREEEDASNIALESSMIADYAISVRSADAVTSAQNNINAKAMQDDYHNEIVEMLQINNIEAEETSEGIRAKGKKEDIEMALYYFEDNIEIKQDGEYVIITEIK